MFGSVTSCIYYAFYCDIFTRNLWIILHSITGFCSFWLSLTDWFNHEKNIKFKVSVLVGVGTFCGITCVSLWYKSLWIGLDSDA